jgi:hypothetical protein
MPPSTVDCVGRPLPPVATVVCYGSVDEWLADIKMERYSDSFARCGYTTMERVTSITHRDLATTLGVSLVGHQKKILNSVQALRAAHQMQASTLPPPQQQRQQPIPCGSDVPLLT